MIRWNAFAAAGIIACGAAVAAPLPRLEQAAGIVCMVHAKAQAGRWQPTLAQIADLERLLSTYFAQLPVDTAKLPAPGVVYARQYSGIVVKGRKIIHGRFYPASDPAPDFANPGECWVSMDGGPAYWDVFFDPKAGRVISHKVNGLS